MVALYDPKNAQDFLAVLNILREHGVELSTSDEADPATGQKQILVAEEDVPFAEELLQRLEPEYPERLRH